MGSVADPHGWRQEGTDLVRGVAAGAIVGMPLLYTMETWARGMSLSGGHLLVLLAAALAINTLFCFFSGFRNHYSVGGAVSDAVTAVGIGLLFSTAVLFLIGSLTFGTGPTDALGRILVEALGVSLGVSFANSQVRGKDRSKPDQKGEGGKAEEVGGGGESAEWKQLKDDLRDLGATVAGATVFAVSIAPTEEVILITTRLLPWQQLLLMAASLGLCYAILFAAGFQQREVYVPSPFQSPLAETVMCYAVSLLVALGLLYLVGWPGTLAHVSTAAGATVVLGLPAVVGGAAGRLIV